MNRTHNPKLTNLSKELRKSMTKEERHLWYDFLRSYPVKIYKQRIVGPYIVDFYCASAKLVIEIDGSQHYDATGQNYDARRTGYFEELGLMVVRYSNADINVRFSEVCDSIDHVIRQRLDD